MADEGYITTIGGHPGFVAGRWYSPVTVVPAAGTAPGAGSIRLIPFSLPKRMKVSNLGVRVSTADAAPGHFQLAIYGADDNALPTGFSALKTADMSAAATGLITAAVVASATLSAGLYYMAVNTDSASAAFQTPAAGAALLNYLIGTTSLATLATSVTSMNAVKTIAQTYGTWPDLTGATFTDVTTATGAIVFLQAA